jgi:hypothetical protein
MLAKDPPIWFRPSLKKFVVTDPATGKATKVKGEFEPPTIDLFIADELNPLGLIEGEIEAKRGAPRSCEATVVDLIDWSAIAEADLPPELAPSDEEQDAGAARFREALPDAQKAIRTVAEAAGATLAGKGDLLTYKSVRDAIGGRTGRAAVDWTHRLVEKMWAGKLECAADPTDPAAVAAWLAGPAGAWNRRLVTIIKVLKAIRRAGERHQGAPEDRQTGYLRASPLGEHGRLGMGLTARQVSQVRREWLGGAAVFLDATWQTEIAERFLPSITEVVHANVPTAQTAAFVTQTWDSTFNMTKIDAIIKEANAGKPRRLAQLATWITLEALRLKGCGKKINDEPSPDLLVLCTMKLEKALENYWGARKPTNILLWHYGAVRGLNAARGVAGVVAIGRIMPSAEVIADLRSIIDGEPSEVPVIFVQTDGEWRVNADRSRAWKFPRRKTVLADPLANSILDSITYAELEQAVVGRARLLRREGERVEINVLGSSPINGLFVDRLVRTDELLRRSTNPDLEILSRGVDLRGLGRNKRSWMSQSILGVSAEALKKRRQRARSS